MTAEHPGATRWPVLVWLTQLVPAAALFAGASWRLGHIGGAMHGGWLTVGVAATAWMAIAAAPLVSGRVRRWVVARHREWLLVAGASLIGVVVLDVGLTATGVVPTLADQRQRSLAYSVGRYSEYRLVPGTVAMDERDDIVIDNRGLRAPSPAASAGIRILFLGGSQVFDFHGSGWPARVGELLARRNGGVSVINAAVPGYNSTDSVRAYLTDLWLLKPDIVFLCHGWNDIKYFKRMADGTPYRGRPPPAPVSWNRDWRLYPDGVDRVLTVSSLYRRTRIGLIESVITEEGYDARGDGGENRVAGSGEFPGQAGPRQFRINLELVADLAEQTGAELVLCRQARADLTDATAAYAARNTRLTVAQVQTGLATCDAIAAAVATGRGLALIDMHAGLGGHPQYFRDAIHFSAEGANAAATLVAMALESSVLHGRSAN